MSKFFEELWLSVFEPGTNASLVLATHVSFALLQATFFLLLIGTWSIHFVFLSLISAALWTAITWFIKEVEIVRKAEEREKKEKEKGVVEGVQEGEVVGEEKKEL